MKTFEEYQIAVHKTIIYPPDVALPYLFCGLAAEAGEVAGKYAKFLRDGTDRKKMEKDVAKELGDALWFIAVICSELDIPLENVAQMNLNKLYSRLDRGVLGGSGDDR